VRIKKIVYPIEGHAKVQQLSSVGIVPGDRTGLEQGLEIAYDDLPCRTGAGTRADTF
jgi:hypothetical protein